MLETHTRRGFLLGLGSALAAPAVVHAGNLMPIRAPLVDCLELVGYDANGWKILERVPVGNWNKIHSIVEARGFGTTIARPGIIRLSEIDAKKFKAFTDRKLIINGMKQYEPDRSMIDTGNSIVTDPSMAESLPCQP